MYEANSGINGWIDEVRVVAGLLYLPPLSLDAVYSMEAIDAAMLRLSQDRWWESGITMPKLRTYVTFKSLEEPDMLVRSNLKRYGRILLAKLVSGIMPVEIETGCYVGTPREERLCKVCNCGKVEDEFRFLFSCIAYQLECSNYYLSYVNNAFEDFMLSPDSVRVVWRTLSTPVYLWNLYREHREIFYKST